MSDPDTQPEPTMEEILASIRRIISEEEEGEALEAADADENGSVIEDGDLATNPEEEAPEVADEDIDPDDDFEAGLEAEMNPEDSREPELEEVAAEDPELEPTPEAQEVGQPLDLEGLDDDDDFDETVLELTEFVDLDDLDDLDDDSGMVDPVLTEAADADDLFEDPKEERAGPAPEPAADSQSGIASQTSAAAEQVAEPTPLSNIDFSTLVSEEAAAQTSTAFVGFAEQLQHSRGVALGSSARTLEELVKDLLRPMLKEWLDENLPPLAQRLVEREIAKLAGRADDK